MDKRKELLLAIEDLRDAFVRVVHLRRQLFPHEVIGTRHDQVRADVYLQRVSNQLRGMIAELPVRVDNPDQFKLPLDTANNEHEN